MYLKNYYYYFPKVLKPEFCDKIIEIGKEKTQQKAEIADKNLDLRNSTIAWMQDLWLYETIEPFIQQANVQAGWNFEWMGSESCQFTIYKENQHYDWHQDSHYEPYNKPGTPEHNTIRKLSVTVSLEDGDNYEGGNLEFDLRNRSDSKSNVLVADQARAKGSIIVFPSFVWHRVTPVLKGTRYSLVIWSIGPPFK
jgi:PKHD-type hydroxylase